jgi:biopolymer transport protein ExbD
MADTSNAKSDPYDLGHIEESEFVHHESGSKKKKPHKIPDLNIVPMLDVCFNLLIFFIATAHFAAGEGVLPADLPAGVGGKSSANAPKPPEQPLNIILGALGGEDVSIQIEGMTSPPANFAELFTVLKGLQSGPSNPNGIYAPDNPVIIKPDGAVPWGHVVNAFNAAIRAKYTNVNFAQPTKK